jgi:hypothetical protein
MSDSAGMVTLTMRVYPLGRGAQAGGDGQFHLGVFRRVDGRGHGAVVRGQRAVWSLP